MDMATLDGPDRLNPMQGGFGGSQRFEAAHRFDQLLQCGVVTLDPVVLPFAVDMQNPFAREFEAVRLTGHAGVAVGRVCCD